MLNLYFKFLFLLFFVFSSQLKAMQNLCPQEDYFDWALGPGNTKSLQITLKDGEANDPVIDSLASDAIALAYKSKGNWFDKKKIFGQFIVARTNYHTEVLHPDYQSLCEVEFTPEGLYQNGKLLTTPKTLWALDAYGKLYILPLDQPQLLEGLTRPHHAYFFRKEHTCCQQEPFYGLPASCAGELEVSHGKITEIDNISGHYEPTILQLSLALAYLHSKETLAEDIKVRVAFPNDSTPNNAEKFNDFNVLLSIANRINLDF